MSPLNSIGNRLTPSVPQEITFGAQPIASGKKFTTLFGHMASASGDGTPFQVYTVVNVGDPDVAQDEVDDLAGSGSQIGQMVSAFIGANSKAGRSNFPALRVVLLPYSTTDFGPNDEAITAVKFLRSDMFVSCYGADDSSNRTKLLDLCSLISGIDRDLQGQFGSFVTLGTLEDLSTAVALDINNQYAIVAYLQDTNTEATAITSTTVLDSKVLSAVVQAFSKSGATTSGSATLTGITSTAGIQPGATISGTGIPVGSKVLRKTATTLIISANATATATGITFTIANVAPTAGIYPGATLSGTGIPAGTTVVSVTKDTITMSAAATAAGTAIAVAIQNVVSQELEIVAAAHAGALMGTVFPYKPVHGMTIGGLVPPKKLSDWISIDPNGASEQALTGGLSPLYVQPGNTVGFIRTRTTWTTLAGNITKTSYFDWQELITLNDFREDCYLISQNPPFNNNPGGSKASQRVANLFKDEVLNQAKFYEDNEAFQGVKELSKFFIVQVSTTSRGRFDFRIPVNVLPGLYVIAGNIVGVTTFDFII